MGAPSRAGRPDAPEVTIRPAAADDAARAADVWWRSRTAAVPQIPPPVHTADEVRRWFAEVLVPDGQTWIATEADPDGDRVVAVLTLDGDDLDQLYVDPDRGGRGIGSMLVDLAKALRPDGLELWTFRSNLPAQAFYRRHGFVEVAWTDGSGNEEGEPDIRMAWRPGAGSGRAVRGAASRRSADRLTAVATTSAMTGAADPVNQGLLRSQP